MEYLKLLSLERRFFELESELKDEEEKILEIESSKRSSKQKRKLSYLQKAIKNCKNGKTDHNLIKRITNL